MKFCVLAAIIVCFSFSTLAQVTNTFFNNLDTAQIPVSASISKIDTVSLLTLYGFKQSLSIVLSNVKKINTSANEGMAHENSQSVISIAHQWKNFSATVQQKDVYLQWQIEIQQIPVVFIIEKSSDGISFDEIGRMQVSTNMETKNSFIDAAPQKGTNFYRIKQIDANNYFTYSPIRKIMANERQSVLHILQNPVQGNNLQVAIKGQPDAFYSIRIYSSQGKLLMQKNAEQGTNSIDLSKLTPNLYLAELLQNDRPVGEKLWVVKQ
jgi:hypothetical protein